MEKEILHFPAGKTLLSAKLPAVFQFFADELKINMPIHFRLNPTGKSGEGFRCEVNQEGAVIDAASESGWFYGLQTLLNEIRDNGLHEMTLSADPVAPERGLKLYLPPPTEEGFTEFKKIIDFAARCKCNFIMLELGGALEYKSHPEINAAWLDYAA